MAIRIMLLFVAAVIGVSFADGFQVFTNFPSMSVNDAGAESSGECDEYLSSVAALPACNLTSRSFPHRVDCVFNRMSSWCGRLVTYKDYVLSGCDSSDFLSATSCRAASVPSEFRSVDFVSWKSRNAATCNTYCKYLSKSAFRSPALVSVLRDAHCSCLPPAATLPEYIGYVRYYSYAVMYYIASSFSDLGPYGMGEEEIAILTDSKFNIAVGFKPDKLVQTVPFIVLAFTMFVMAVGEFPFYVRCVVAVVLVSTCIYLQSVILTVIAVGLCVQTLTARSSSASERSFCAFVVLYIIALCFTMVFDSDYLSLAAIVVTSLASIRFLYALYGSSRTVDLSVIIFILFGAGVTLVFVENYAVFIENDVFLEFVKFICFGMFPFRISTTFVSGLAHNAAAATSFVSRLEKLGYPIPRWYVLPLFVVRYFMMVIPRVAVGALHYRKAGGLGFFRRLERGARMYIVDLFAPLRLITSIWYLDYQKMLLSGIVILLMVFEFTFCFEVFVLHIGAGVFLHAVSSDDSRRIQSLVSNFHMCSDKFPVDGSLPKYDTNLFSALSSCVHRIQILTDDHVISGTGLLASLKGSGGPKTIISAFHVTKDAVSVQLLHYFDRIVSFDICSTLRLGRSSDPVAVGTVTDEHGLSFADVVPLQRHEIGSVAYLTIMFVKSAVSIIKDFKILPDVGRIEVVCDLTKGESGSPCFAILKDGVIKLAGVVSAGTDDKSVPNIVSCIVDERSSECNRPGIGSLPAITAFPIPITEATLSGIKPDYGKGEAIYNKMALTNADKVDSGTFVDEGGRMISRPTLVVMPDSSDPGVYCRMLCCTVDNFVAQHNKLVNEFRPQRPGLRIQSFKPFKDNIALLERALSADDGLGALSSRMRSELRDAAIKGRIIEFHHIDEGGGVHATLWTTGSLTNF